MPARERAFFCATESAHRHPDLAPVQEIKVRIQPMVCPPWFTRLPFCPPNYCCGFLLIRTKPKTPSNSTPKTAFAFLEPCLAAPLISPAVPQTQPWPVNAATLLRRRRLCFGGSLGRLLLPSSWRWLACLRGSTVHRGPSSVARGHLGQSTLGQAPCACHV